MTGFPRFFIDGLPLDHEGLADMGKVEVVIQFCRDPDISRLNPAMFPVTRLGKISRTGMALKMEGDRLKQCGLVSFCREVIVCAPVLHQIAGQVTLGEQCVCGDGSAFNLSGIQHGCSNLYLIGLLFFITAFYRECTDFFWV